MLREIVDIHILKVVQVGTPLIEEALSFSKPNFSWHTYNPITVWTAKPQSHGRDGVCSPGLRSKWLFVNINMVLEVNTQHLCFHSRRWFEKAVYREEIPPGLSGVKTLAVYLLFCTPDSHKKEVLLVNQNVSVNLKIYRELCMLWASGLDFTAESGLLFSLAHNEF